MSAAPSFLAAEAAVLAELSVRAQSRDRQPYAAAVDAFRRALLVETLREHHGNRSHAARALGLQRTYLQRLLREFGLGDAVPRQIGRPQ